MTKIVLIGAGSVSFGPGTLCDLFAARQELAGSTIALVDTDPEALRTMAQLAQRMNRATGKPFIIEATPDRREALPGAQFVIIAVAVRRNERWRLDFQIPLKHGVKQVLGENGGPGGLNHFTWVLDLRHKHTGEDLYPAFRRAMAEKCIEEVSTNGYSYGVKLCHYLMDTFGYWPSPSDDHVGEYLSYAWEYCGLEGYDFDAVDRATEEGWRRLRHLASGEEPVDELLQHRSGEIAVPIIVGVLDNTHQYELAVNVPNAGFIPNLPSWAIVEVPATVDATGVHGVTVGPLPEPIAAMCHTQIAIIDRMVEAAVGGDRRAALQALLLDPLVNGISQAEAILDEMLAVHRDFLPQFYS